MKEFVAEAAEKRNKIIEDDIKQAAAEAKLAKSEALTRAKLQKAAFLRKFAIKRVYHLLHRAKALLSPDSRDMQEVTDRMDVFHDLHISEHRSLLVEKKEIHFAFRCHYHDLKEMQECEYLLREKLLTIR